MMIFKEESVKDVLDEIKPLLKEHWNEIAHYKDIPFDPDYEAYLKLDESGFLKVFTARTDTGVLIGYAVYFIKHNIHYRSSLQALQDILYLHPAHRGRGSVFISWCDDQLKSKGVQIVSQHIKAAHNWSRVLERMGYELMDLIYVKRLDH